jgi:predicted O-methyltransferase YrrM
VDEPLDPYQNILDATARHRSHHHCKAYPFGDGASLGVLAAAAAAHRIVECGTALGYTACWLARGSATARIDTIDFDEQHVRLARENIAVAGFGDRVTVHHGAFEDVLPSLTSGYDIAFFDGFAPSLQDLDLLASLLRIGGILISTNLGLSGRETAAYRKMICDPANWMTSLMAEGGRTAVSVKLRT